VSLTLDLIRRSRLLADIDTFVVLSVAAGMLFVLSFGLKKNELGGGRMVLE
jgi:hypothetical protein